MSDSENARSLQQLSYDTQISVISITDKITNHERNAFMVCRLHSPFQLEVNGNKEVIFFTGLLELFSWNSRESVGPRLGISALRQSRCGRTKPVWDLHPALGTETAFKIECVCGHMSGWLSLVLPSIWFWLPFFQVPDRTALPHPLAVGYDHVICLGQ